MPLRRPRHRTLPLRSAGLIVAGAMMLCADALAQTATYQNPFAPPSDSDQKIPPRIRNFKPTGASAQVGPPTSFQSAQSGTGLQTPQSGAGKTGFDSTNARKKAKRKPAPALDTTAPSSVRPLAASPTVSEQAKRAMASGPPGLPPVALTPVYTQPKKRKAHTEPDDPYAALGLRGGSFIWYPALELSVGRNSNPEQVPGGRAATTYTGAPELRVQSDWSRHELKADLRGSYTGFSPDSTPTLSRPYFNGKADGRIDVTRNDRIDLGARALVSTDNPNSPNLQAGLDRLPVYTVYGGSAGYTHRFNRLEIGVKGDAERTVYQDSKLVDGTTASNEDRNYNQYGGSVRAGYELTPGIVPFVEGGGDTRRHDLTTDFSGYQRDSSGKTVKLGSTFELSRLLTGEFAVGYTRRDYDDPRLDALKAVIGNASLVWTATPLTTVKLTGASTVGESTQPGVSGVLYRDFGLQVDHALRRWLIATLKVGIGNDDYVGSDRSDMRYSLGAGLTYKLNRMVQLKGEFRQDWLKSNVSGVDYTASVFLVGLRLQY